MKAAKGEGSSFVYTRWDNPTVRRLEKKLAELEGAEDSAFFSSGMAAISTSVLSFVREGSHLLAVSDLYGETYRLIHDFLPRLGVETTMVETTDIVQMRRNLKKNTTVVYIESPTNPTLKLVDIAKAARLAHGVGALLLIDSTFASPINQKPLSLGADIVLHSATKSLNGHADVIAGAAAARRGLVEKIKLVRRILGGTLDPHAAWLTLRGIKTMAVRVRAQNRNAQALAEYLSRHKKVAKVHYPGLRTHPQHTLARRQMKGFGGMLSFEVRGSMKDAMKFTESVKVATLAASLGGVETLVAQPATLTHTQLSDRKSTRLNSSHSQISYAVFCLK